MSRVWRAAKRSRSSERTVADLHGRPSRRRPRWLAPAASLLAIAVLAACESAAPEPIRVGLVAWPAYDLPFLARERGWIPEERVELVRLESPAVALEAYRTGFLDAVALTLDYALQLSAESDEHRVVMVIDESRGADAILAREGIASMADLAGKRVGLEASALGVYVLSRGLESVGLTVDDVHLVSRDVGGHVDLWTSGTVDAVVTYEPARTRILEAGATSVFDSRQIPGEIVDVLITRRGVIDTRRAALAVLVSGWFRAGALLNESAEAVTTFLGAQEGISPEVAATMLEGIDMVGHGENVAWFRDGAPALVAAAYRVGEALEAAGLARGVPRPDSLFDDRVLAEIAP